jgi:hypothetical protein
VVVDYGYTKTIGGSGYDFGRASVVDSNGNIYITGRFSTTVDFDPGVGVDEHTSIGDNDHFLTKINADGTYGWTKTIKGISTDSISVDSNNNIYLAGCFIGTVDFDFSEDVDEYTSEGECDIFLTKINFDESYGYTKIIGGTGNDGGFSLTIDYDHNIYLVG